MENQTKKIGKFKASRLLLKESWKLLKQDKEILLFPLHSFIFSILAFIIISAITLFAVFGTGFMAVFKNPEMMETVTNQAFTIGGIIMVIVMQMIDMYFKSGIILAVNERINKGNFNYKESLSAVKKKSKKILSWALVNASVGIILRSISERSKMIGKIVTGIIGAAWNITTFFMLPIIVLEDLDMKDAGKKSVSTIKKTWGEAFLTNIGVGFALMLFWLLGFIPVVLALLSGIKLLVIASIILMVLYTILIGLVGSTLDTIIRTVLYRYANDGTLPESFDPELAQAAFKK